MVAADQDSLFPLPSQHQISPLFTDHLQADWSYPDYSHQASDSRKHDHENT
jgi:hypothetical protein